MNQFLIILLIAILWGVADLMRKIASGSTNNQFLAFVFNLGATISPLIILIWIYFKREAVTIRPADTLISLLAGLLVGIGGILLFSLLSGKETVTTVFPLIRIISLVIVALGGVFFFFEQVSFKFISGFILSLISVWLIMTR